MARAGSNTTKEDRQEPLIVWTDSSYERPTGSPGSVSLPIFPLQPPSIDYNRPWHEPHLSSSLHEKSTPFLHIQNTTCHNVPKDSRVFHDTLCLTQVILTRSKMFSLREGLIKSPRFKKNLKRSSFTSNFSSDFKALSSLEEHFTFGWGQGWTHNK